MQTVTADIKTLNKDVLISLLESDAVPMVALQQRYGALLELVRVLIGVVPNCDRYLEIWPPAFRSYNLLVPNFLNLPFSVFGIGGAPKELVGLGMYVASRAAECPYCSAHTCSFALRRGADPQTVARALVGGDGFTDKELATIAAARSLARIPCELTPNEHRTIKQQFSVVEAEWIVLGIAMMGFLNKFMDAIGVQLETSTVGETRDTMGADWTPGKAGRALDHENIRPAPSTDNLLTRLSVIKHAPTALKLDKEWLKGVPGTWPHVGEFLQQQCGYNFPMLSLLNNKRAVRAIAAVLRDNLDNSQSVIGIDVKIKAGLIFAAVINDKSLEMMVGNLLSTKEMSLSPVELLQRFAANESELPADMELQEIALLTLARAASPSPAEITSEIVHLCEDAELPSAGIVEMITWLSVLQMLHRLSSYLLFSETATVS